MREDDRFIAKGSSLILDSQPLEATGPQARLDDSDDTDGGDGADDSDGADDTDGTDDGGDGNDGTDG